MGILTKIPTLPLDTLTKEVNSQSCANAITELDVAITRNITASILWAIAIIGTTIILCVAISALSRYKEQRLRYRFEETKRKDEQALQEYRNRMDSAWRCLNNFYKKNESVVTDSEAKMAEASLDFLASTINQPQKTESGQSK